MSRHKHVLNDPSTLVVDSLKGLCLANPAVALDEKHRVVYKRSSPSYQVSLISGGGSGHEPAHAGFVGDGLLSAAVCGNVFASPNAAQIRRAIELVGTRKGTLIVVKNYTGDVLNFGLASEQYKTSGGVGDVRLVVVGDDVAVGRTQGGIVGRRGLAGTVLVYKIAAALARSGASLDRVEAVASFVAKNLGTIGVGLDHCHVPGTEEAESHLAADEIELGMGIHNESGYQRLKPFPTLTELMDKMMRLLTSTTDSERSFLSFKGDGNDELALMVNNLGSISELELGSIAGEAAKWLKKNEINVKRQLVGTYITSLNMPGFSITLLLLPRPNDAVPFSASELITLLDEPADAPGWKWHAHTEVADSVSPETVNLKTEAPTMKQDFPLAPSDPKAFTDAITRACEAIIGAEPEITKQDQIAGDGDAGLTLKAGAEGVLGAVTDGTIRGEDAASDVRTIAEIVDDRMGGTSGALYSIFFSSLTRGLRGASNMQSTLDSTLWSEASAIALETLQKYTNARPPSRTLMDPLTAFVEALPTGLKTAVAAAKQAAEDTKKMSAKAGRSVYVDQEQLSRADVPDPGAWGVAVLVAALVDEDK